MTNFTEIGTNFSTYLASLSPQVKNNSLQWYLSGSLATTIMGNANQITEIELDEQNNITNEFAPKTITEEQQIKMEKFSRKLGTDIDVVNVNGNLFHGAPQDNKPSIQKVIENVPNILDLMSWGESLRGTMYIDNLETEREISYHPVAKVKTPTGDIYVTAPPEQLAHKLSETIWLCNNLSENDVSGNIKNDMNLKYNKDIKDLATMFYGFKDLYENDEFLNRIYYALNEKDGSIFSIHNSTHNKDKALKNQEELNNYIIKNISTDSSNYLKSIATDNSYIEIVDFFNNLMKKRMIDLENIPKKQSVDSITPLQKREAELSALEKKAKLLDKELQNFKTEYKEFI